MSTLNPILADALRPFAPEGSELNQRAARNPLEQARMHLIARLWELSVPPQHAIADIPDLIREAANIFDEWLYAVGNHVGERVNVDLDMRNFQGACLGAVEGNATYEIESAIEDSRRFRTLRRAV